MPAGGSSPRRAIPRRDVDVVAVVRSPRNDESPLRAQLDTLPCHVIDVPLGPSLDEQLTMHPPRVVVVDHTGSDFNVERLVAELVQLSAALVVIVAADAACDDGWVTARLDDGAHLVIGPDASPELVVAQLRAVLRAAPRPNRGPELLTVGDVTIDVGAHELRLGGEPVSCSPVLFSLLVELASAPNKVLPRETLLGRVWGVSPSASHLRRVRIAASQLRRLLGDGPRRPRIETVARVGYCLTTTQRSPATQAASRR